MKFDTKDKENVIFYKDEEQKEVEDVYDLANCFIEIGDFMSIEEQGFMIGYLSA